MWWLHTKSLPLGAAWQADLYTRKNIWIKIQIKLFKLLKQDSRKIITVKICDFLILKKIPPLFIILHFLAPQAVCEPAAAPSRPRAHSPCPWSGHH